MITESRLLDRKLLRRGATFDQSLLWMVVLMTSFSLIMVYSASIAYASHDGGSKYFYLIRQAIFLACGGFLGLIAVRIPLRTWKMLTPLILLFSLITVSYTHLTLPTNREV